MQATIVFEYGTPRQRLLSWFLADTGIAVDTLVSLDDVVAACHARRVRAIVLNSQVPRSDALDIARKLKDHCPDATIFYLEADEDAGQPFDDAVCVCSPHEADALVTGIRNVLDR